MSLYQIEVVTFRYSGDIDGVFESERVSGTLEINGSEDLIWDIGDDTSSTTAFGDTIFGLSTAPGEIVDLSFGDFKMSTYLADVNNSRASVYTVTGESELNADDSANFIVFSLSEFRDGPDLYDYRFSGFDILIPEPGAQLSDTWQDNVPFLSASGFGGPTIAPFALSEIGTVTGSPPFPEPLILIGTEDGADTLTGDDNDDFLQGLGGDDVLSAGPGNDSLVGNDGNDTLSGAQGDDEIAAGGGQDVIRAGTGNDNIGGGPGDDVIDAGGGNDTVGGGTGNDTIYTGGGVDAISGGPGDDLIDGRGGFSATSSFTAGGSFGNDTIEGSRGADNLGGGAGSDLIFGRDGNDSVGGGEGGDTIAGASGNDFLAGGGGDDSVQGGRGDDTINSGTGNDTLIGGRDADLFVFVAGNGGTDRIVDFEDGLDMIRLRGFGGIDDVTIDRTAATTTLTAGDQVIVITSAGGVAPPIIDADDILFG